MTVLSENSEVSLLCDFNFSGLEEEVSQFTVTAGDTHTHAHYYCLCLVVYRLS